MSRPKIPRRRLLVAALSGTIVMVLSATAQASSTHSFIYHEDTRFTAGEVWFNSGLSGEHRVDPVKMNIAPNSFVIKDTNCGDGWGVGVRWTLDGTTYESDPVPDCGGEKEQIIPAPQAAASFSWRAFKWDTNGISPTTYENPVDDWVGADSTCGEGYNYVSRVAAYGLDTGANDIGLTFAVTIWPTEAAKKEWRDRDSAGDIVKMWDEVKRCTPLPSSLNRDQLESMQKQLACHAIYGFSESLTGPTWDLEANRENISGSAASIAIKSAWSKCNWSAR